MRIGYDVTPLTVPHAGVARYTAQLLSGLQTHAPDHEYHLLAHRPLFKEDKSNGMAGRFVDGIRGFPMKMIWMQLFLPPRLLQARIDLCHFTNYAAPIATPCPLVVTFHDMSLYMMPGYHKSSRLVALGPLLPLVARRANAIITVSESARQDLIRVLRIPAERVHVVYEAAMPQFRKIEDVDYLATVARRHRLAPGFLLYVGTIEPRKNLIRVVEALHQLRQSGMCQPLVIVGRFGWKYKSLLARIEALGLGDMVRLMGFVSDDDLPAIFNLAGVFLFPSLYEGFGLPVVEAMACGTPVVTSNVGATAEIADKGALLVDPLRSTEIAETIGSLLADPQLRQQMTIRGQARAAQFSWERASRETLAIYHTVLAGAAGRG